MKTVKENLGSLIPKTLWRSIPEWRAFGMVVASKD